MFKKKCSKCNKKIGKSYDFCPFCGNNFSSKHEKEDYGFLGKNDFIDEKSNFFKPKGSFMDKVFQTAMKELPSMIKMIEKQMQDSVEQPKKMQQSELPNNLRVQFFVNGKKVLPEKSYEQEPIKLEIKNFSKEKLKKLSKLTKKEPKSKIRRLSNKIIYELAVPGVKDLNDVLINSLENSIEIKALSKDKYYLKNLNIMLPLLKYSLEKGNLVLEFEAKN